METELTINLVNGAKIMVIGMDKPERIEGKSLDGIILDEYGNMHPNVWPEHVRPMLSAPGRPPGWAWFIGVPEGRNHYYDLFCDASRTDGEWVNWDTFKWHSADIMDPAEVAAARGTMDPLIFRQEYEAEFVSFEGLAYYQFNSAVNALESRAPKVKTHLPLSILFDFNHSPGVAIIAQEQDCPEWMKAEDKPLDDRMLMALDEIYIARGSNTLRVCEEIIERWGWYPSQVRLYGDASGGAKSSSGVAGSDWDLIDQAFKPNWGHQLSKRVPDANPRERSRVNSVNSRFSTYDGRIGALVNPRTCPRLVRDMEGVTLDGDGAIVKDKKSNLTHLSDAWGYWTHRIAPIRGNASGLSRI